MPEFKMNRRQFGLGLAATAAALPVLTRPSLAAGAVTVATFPNAWEQAYNKIITPMLAAKGTTLTIAPALTTAQIAKVLAAKQGSAPPPYDALLLSPGDIVVAEKNGLLQEIDPSKIPSWSKLLAPSQGKYGPTVTLEVDGFAYNPDVVPKPTGYKDLFENPAFAGKVSWTGFDSNTAIEFYSEIAKVYGSGPYDMDAVQRALFECELFVAIGTSGLVYPAAAFVHYAIGAGADTLELNLAPETLSDFAQVRQGPATETVPAWVGEML